MTKRAMYRSGGELEGQPVHRLAMTPQKNKGRPGMTASPFFDLIAKVALPDST
jgi:hypothetical protein